MRVLTCGSTPFFVCTTYFTFKSCRDVLQQDPIATYNPVPLSNVTDTLQQIHFPTYFSSFTPRSFPDRLILTHPPFVKSLSVILNETSSDVVEAYLVIRAALSLSPYLSVNTEVWKARRSLLETLTGIKKGAFGDRAEYCVGQVEDSLGFAAGRYFVQKTFGGNSKNKAMKVISGGLCNQYFNLPADARFSLSTGIVKAFKQSIEHIDWMDEVSSKAAAEKVRLEILLCQPL
jgi:endothelin-converting enzyme